MTTHPKMLEWRREGIELLHEIVGAAECIGSARAPDSRHGIVRTDALWLLLCGLERSRYCCSISDVARLLRISRQAAHQIARKAELAGAVELVPNHGDRRIVQVLLTRGGRSELATTRSAQASVVAVLLNGLDTREIAATARILRAIRHRLLRDERERRRR